MFLRYIHTHTINNNNLSHNFFPLFWGVFGFQLIESTIWYITIESGSSDAV